MTALYTFIIRQLCITILFLSGKMAAAQNAPLTFVNFGTPVKFPGGTTNYSSKIHEIIINSDSTFEFWCKPIPASCFTWRSFKGSWKKKKDTIIFFDKYEIEEIDIRETYKRDSKQSFFIHFKTDKNTTLTNKTIKVQYQYDFNAHIEDVDTVLSINAYGLLVIPFKTIPYLNQLADIRIEYQLNDKEKRVGYLTENKVLNVKEGNNQRHY